MGTVIDFERETWSCCDALINIFFSDWDELNDDENLRFEIRSYIASYPTNKNCKPPNLSEDRLKNIRSLIDTLHPISKRPVSRLLEPPLVWIKFAFFANRNGVILSETFIKAYAQWRLTRSITYGPETIVQTMGPPRKIIENRPFAIARHKFLGHPLDRFLLSSRVPLVLGEGAEWKISGAQTSKTNKQKLDAVKTATGENLTNNLIYCLETAVASGRIPALHNKKVEGRFLCDITKEELAILLMKVFKHRLPYRETSIKRALSTFVACPGYRLKRT